MGTANPGANKPWSSVLDNYVTSLVFDGTNIYACGAFTHANGTTSRNRLAKFETNGNLDATWDPDANGTVESLDTSGNFILAGGGFTQMKGVNRLYLAKLNKTNGGSSNWATADYYVRKIYVEGGTCYVGGDFGTLGGATRHYLGSINISSGAATSFDPNPNGSVYSLSKSGNILYYGGSFQTVGATNRNRAAASNVSTNALQSWDPQANSTVTFIKLDGTNIILAEISLPSRKLPAVMLHCLNTQRVNTRPGRLT